MSLIYNQAYKVPVWVVIALPAADGKAALIADAIKTAGAKSMPWPGDTFPLTINKMALKGWSHEVNKKMPFFASIDFLTIAATHHLEETYGPAKRLTGTPSRPYNTLKRKIETGDDYVRLFNDILVLEPDAALSYLFDVGKNCHEGDRRTKVYVTVGAVPTNVLQRIASRVITISDVAAADVNVNDYQTDEETVDASMRCVASALGLI
jgi:hypothetical protein